MSRNRLSLLVAVLASVVVAVGGFFLGVQPQLASAQSSDQQRMAAEQSNATAQRRITQLREENRSLPRKKAELAVLEGSIPSSLNQSAFYQELYDLAGTSGVTIASLTTSDAQTYAPPQTAEVSSSASTPASSPSATAAPGTAPIPSVPAAPTATTNSAITSANFSAVPVTVGVKGSFQQAIAYMKAVQNGKRLFLVSSIVSSSSSSSGSDAETATGPTTWTLSGFIYVLQDATSTKAEQSASTTSTKG